MPKATKKTPARKESGRKGKIKLQRSANTLMPIHPQHQSSLMRLPQEIRDLVYAAVFCSTRFASGKRWTDSGHHTPLVSAFNGNGLSLLRTCKRMNTEIGSNWLGQVLFHFEMPEAMLDKLASTPTNTLTHIRHLRGSGEPLPISFEDRHLFYRTAQALKLLPGLQLDRLTVIVCGGPQMCYDTISTLIAYSHGWKELHFHSHSSEFLGYTKESMGWTPGFDDQYLPHPQPCSWQSVLERRDGTATVPKIKIYRHKYATTSFASSHVSDTTVFEQAFATGQDDKTYGLVEDHLLMKDGEKEREVLVVAQRGTGVDYEENEGSPYLAIGDLREDVASEGCKTWKDIKAWHHAMRRNWEVDPQPFDSGQNSESEVPIIDSYGDVDEYTWPPSPFDPFW